eukprot:ctg_299.g171
MCVFRFHFGERQDGGGAERASNREATADRPGRVGDGEEAAGKPPEWIFGECIPWTDSCTEEHVSSDAVRWTAEVLDDGHVLERVALVRMPELHAENMDIASGYRVWEGARDLATYVGGCASHRDRLRTRLGRRATGATIGMAARCRSHGRFPRLQPTSDHRIDPTQRMAQCSAAVDGTVSDVPASPPFLRGRLAGPAASGGRRLPHLQRSPIRSGVGVRDRLHRCSSGGVSARLPTAAAPAAWRRPAGHQDVLLRTGRRQLAVAHRCAPTRRPQPLRVEVGPRRSVVSARGDRGAVRGCGWPLGALVVTAPRDVDIGLVWFMAGRRVDVRGRPGHRLQPLLVAAARWETTNRKTPPATGMFHTALGGALASREVPALAAAHWQQRQRWLLFRFLLPQPAVAPVAIAPPAAWAAPPAVATARQTSPPDTGRSAPRCRSEAPAVPCRHPARTSPPETPTSPAAPS